MMDYSGARGGWGALRVMEESTAGSGAYSYRRMRIWDKGFEAGIMVCVHLHNAHAVVLTEEIN